MASNKQNGKSARATIEVDREALDQLKEARSSGESFSEVIKRCVRPRQSAADILRTMRKARISSSTLQAIDESASRRRRTAHKTKG
jgi:predicted CopG family antitoxin